MSEETKQHPQSFVPQKFRTDCAAGVVARAPNTPLGICGERG